LDRGHIGAVGDVRVRKLKHAVRIAPVPADSRHSLRLEMWGAHRKSSLLAELLETPVHIVAPDGSVLSSRELDLTI
jgi:hypothetical protein